MVRQPPFKVGHEYPLFSQRIQGDIRDQSIHLVDHFVIFIILIDASKRWTQVCLLSTSNIIFARLIAQIIRLRAQFPYYPIKTMRVNSVNILNL